MRKTPEVTVGARPRSPAFHEPAADNANEVTGGSKMMKKILILGVLALVSASLATAEEIDFDYFYNELAPT